MANERTDHGDDPTDNVSEEVLDRRGVALQREVSEALLLSALRAQEQLEEQLTQLQDLRTSEQDLRLLGEARERILGVLGHDLRQPLSVIDLAAQRALQVGARPVKQVEMIRLCVSRMLRMIEHLLDLTRARAGGGLVLDLAPVDLAALCHEVAEELRLRTRREIRCELEGPLLGVWDGDRIFEALENLTGNAIDYADPDTGLIIRARSAAEEVVIEVCNQGPPIPAELLPTLFEPFRRGEPSPLPRSKHLGLGLYICREIARAHGGDLDVRCADGTVTFRLRLPRS